MIKRDVDKYKDILDNILSGKKALFQNKKEKKDDYVYCTDCDHIREFGHTLICAENNEPLLNYGKGQIKCPEFKQRMLYPDKNRKSNWVYNLAVELYKSNYSWDDIEKEILKEKKKKGWKVPSCYHLTKETKEDIMSSSLREKAIYEVPYNYFCENCQHGFISKNIVKNCKRCGSDKIKICKDFPDLIYIKEEKDEKL